MRIYCLVQLFILEFFDLQKDLHPLFEDVHLLKSRNSIGHFGSCSYQTNCPTNSVGLVPSVHACVLKFLRITLFFLLILLHNVYFLT